VFVIFGDTVNTQGFPDEIYSLLWFVTTFCKFLFVVMQVFFCGKVGGSLL